MDFVFDEPRPDDRLAIATLFAEDMNDIGVERTIEEMLNLAGLIVDDGGTNSFCRVVRPGPDAKPVGIVLANILFSPKYAGKSLWIEHLYVTHDWRRHGLGRALVEVALDWAELNGLAGVDLEAYQGNAPAAILYRSLGFSRLCRERFWLDFGWADEDI